MSLKSNLSIHIRFFIVIKSIHKNQNQPFIIGWNWQIWPKCITAAWLLENRSAAISAEQRRDSQYLWYWVPSAHTRTYPAQSGCTFAQFLAIAMHMCRMSQERCHAGWWNCLLAINVFYSNEVITTNCVSINAKYR